MTPNEILRCNINARKMLVRAFLEAGLYQSARVQLELCKREIEAYRSNYGKRETATSET